MAIAYFIPDQAKLLARSASNQNANSSTNSSGAASNSNQPGTTTTVPSMPQQQQQQQQYQNHQQPHHNNHHFRANITIPLTAYDTPQTSVGCWDLIAQVFCYALRFYHETERLNPTVIQISFEISGSGGGNGSVATPSATQQQEPTAGQDRNSDKAPNKN